MDKNAIKVTKFDAAEYLTDDETIAIYLEETLKEDDPKAFLQALNTVARAKGMTKLSKEIGIPRESLYQSLSENGNPGFYTLWKVASALGCTLSIKKKTAVTA